MSLPKKIFIGSTILFVGIFLFWGVYNLSFKEKPIENAKTISENQPSAETIAKNEARITAISQEKAVSPVLSNDGNVLSYYDADTGRVFQIDLFGNGKRSLSDKNLGQVANAFWSPDKNSALTELKDSDNKNRFSFFNYISRQGKMLSENIVSANWQNSNRIIYTFYDPIKKTGNLSMSDPDGANWKKLTDLSYAKQKIALVPNSGLISFWNNPDAFYETNLHTISPVQGEKKLLFKEKFGADYLWNQNGTKILVSHSSEKGGKFIETGILDGQGQNYKNLDLPTFISKCIWGKDNKTIYCALPGGVPSGSVLPNDYNNKKFFTTDTFWKIDTETGKKTRLIELAEIKEKYDADDLLLNQDESILFFVNRYDGKIYRMKI